MSFAAIDIGNTFAKLCWWPESGNLQEKFCGIYGSLSEVGDILRERKICRTAYSTTRDLTPGESLMVADGGWWAFTTECRLPVIVRYKSPATLGLDRLAAALGAWGRYRGETLMIADLGTALTLDVLTDKGEYLGGNICPGIEMRFQALHDYTSRLPKVNLDPGDELIGNDTVSAIQNGVKWGVANEIVGMYRLVRKKYGCARIVATGGGVRCMEKTLQKSLTESGDEAVNLDFVANLVEEGIKIAYDYNHEEN